MLLGIPVIVTARVPLVDVGVPPEFELRAPHPTALISSKSASSLDGKERNMALREVA
jgi:hypothetical protein